jgi:glycosyltransferase 2 family protein
MTTINETNPPVPARKPVNKITLVIAIIIAGVLLFLSLRNISWQEMLDALKHARLEFVILTLILSAISIFFRGLRWGVLLSAQKKIKPLTMFWATCIGYLGNTILPARAGEVIRSLMLGAKEDISKSYVFATAITERVLDVIILVLIGVFSIPAIGSMPDSLNKAMQVMGVLGVVAVVILFVAPRFSELLNRIVNRLPLPEKVKKPLINFMNEFLLGAQAFINPKRAAGFAGYSAILWFLDATGAIFMSYAFNLHFSYAQAFVLLLAMGLSSAIPSTPGYVGIYQYVAVILLPLYGISRSAALTYILVLQLVGIVNILFWGFIGLRQLNIRSLQDIS